MFPGFDWRKMYSEAKNIEKDIAGFQYKGDGWYINRHDTLFVIHDHDENLWIYVWNYPTARDELVKVLSMDVFHTVPVLG